MKQATIQSLCLCGALLLGMEPSGAQVVDVTVALDTNVVAVGGNTTLRVFAQVVPAQRANADRIFSWYVDVLNTNSVAASANYAAMLKTASDEYPQTSSTGTTDGGHRRAIFDTFLDLPGAGVNTPVELMSIPVTGLAGGQTRFQVQAGTGGGLAHDFQVAPLGGGSVLTGGNYALAEAVLTVSGGLPTGALSISVTNAGGSNRGVTLSWPTTGGFNYTAQFKSQVVGGPVWAPLPGAPHNSGLVFELTSSTQRFYRVTVVPAN
jgi:hypothetical protein